MHPPSSSTAARRSCRIESRLAKASAAPPPDAAPATAELADLATAHTQSDLLSKSSVYLDHAASHPNMDDPFLPNDLGIPIVENDTSDVSAKPRKKTREERQLRQAAEQQLWIREKFAFPDSELLVASFSAALFRHILLQGRMYITTSYVCFYTKLFGKVTKEAFPFATLARVKKRRGGLVANAIKISFAEEAIPPVIIGSLNHRDRAYDLIQERLRAVNPAAAEQKETDDDGSGASVASAPAETEGYLDGADFTTEADGSKPVSLSSHHSRDDTEITRHVSNHLLSDPNGAGVNTITRNSDSSILSSHNNSDVDPGDFSTNSHTADDLSNDSSMVWQTSEDVVDRLYGSAFSKKSERARVVLNCTVKEAFNELFVSEWLTQYHDNSNNRDIAFTEWERGADNFMSRVATFRRPLAYKIGPKETRVKETQRYSFTNDGGVIFELEGQNLDAPYATYFVVESYFELQPHNDGTQTLLILSVAVNFLKSTMLQSKIETGALTETKTAFQRLAEMAAERIDEYCSERPEVPPPAAIAPPSCKRPSGRVPNSAVTGPAKKVRPVRAQRMSLASLDAAPQRERSQRPSGTASDVNSNSIDSAATATPPVPAPVARQRAEPPRSEKAAAVEVHDAMYTKWMRLATVGALALTCVLLLSVVGLLYRMHHGIRALEKMVADAQNAGLAQCSAESCAARMAEIARGAGEVVGAVGGSGTGGVGSVGGGAGTV